MCTADMRPALVNFNVWHQEKAPPDEVRWLYAQFKDAQAGRHVACTGCQNRHPVWLMYRCLYCDHFYCLTCAEEHFGQTREEYHTQL